MKIHMAMAVFVMFAAPAFGQSVQQQQPPQTPQQQVTPQQPLVPQQPRSRVRAMVLPNWPANKPAPVIPIPTTIQPKAWVTTRVPRFVPSAPARPCALKDCQLLEATPLISVATQKPATSNVTNQTTIGSAAK